MAKLRFQALNEASNRESIKIVEDLKRSKLLVKMYLMRIQCANI